MFLIHLKAVRVEEELRSGGRLASRVMTRMHLLLPLRWEMM